MPTKELPPLIIALDYPDRDQSVDLVAKLHGIGPDAIGYKIPHWHDQDTELLSQLREMGHYVILDTRIDDSVDKDIIALQAFLGARVLPHAVTVNPVKGLNREQSEAVKKDIIQFARDRHVDLIGYAEPLPFSPTDDMYKEREVSRYVTACNLQFNAFEIHSTTALYMHERTDQEMTIPSGENPSLIASKFSIGIPENMTEVSYAAHMFSIGITSIYLGRTVLHAQRPIEIVENIFELRAA